MPNQCCCETPIGVCFCRGTATGMQIVLDGFVDTFISGLAADTNGTWIQSPLSGGSFGPGFFDYCFILRDEAATTMDIEIGRYGSLCTDDCTSTSADAGNYIRIIGRIMPADDPQTQIQLDVLVMVVGWVSRCLTLSGFPTRGQEWDYWHFSNVIDLVDCGDILVSLPLIDEGSSGGASPWTAIPNPIINHPRTSCSTLQLDGSGATCEVSILT